MNNNRNNSQNKIQFGFIVEGQSEANFIHKLVSEYFKSSFIPEIIIMSGKASMASSSKIVIYSLMQIGVRHIFMLFDTDYQNVEAQRNYLINPIKNSEYLEYVSIIPVEPMLETWILSSFIENLDTLKKMDLKTQKNKLLELGFDSKPLNFNKVKINFNKLVENNLDFKMFINNIEDKIANCQQRL